MKCPDCENEMVQGVVEVRSTPADFLAVGFSSQHLFFDLNNEYSEVLSCGVKRSAFRCPECSGVFITNDSQCNIDPVTGVVTEYDG